MAKKEKTKAEQVAEAIEAARKVAAENAVANDETEAAETTENVTEATESDACQAADECAETEQPEEKDKKDILIEELNDKYMRTFAEFDNFRKRTEKEKAAMFEVGAKSIIERMLPIVDNFERGLATLSDEEKSQPFADGMDKVYKQLMKALEEAGVTPIEAVGKEFDPNLHNAVMHGEDDSLGENIIAEEFQKGYMYRESVVRYSMVKVIN
ncbi:MAG: nucleotide exchange factor GrpE [Lachnospiraceae bacterium]|nr:nucleotide exchange factor GrpE [Lachnospiraceae bacterium]